MKDVVNDTLYRSAHRHASVFDFDDSQRMSVRLFVCMKVRDECKHISVLRHGYDDGKPLVGFERVEQVFFD